MIASVARERVRTGTPGQPPASRRLVAMAGLCAALGLAGCGHSDLKAPCEATEGALAYAETPHDCGPMRRVNGPLAAIDRITLAGTVPLR